jgi:Yip1-like protein
MTLWQRFTGAIRLDPRVYEEVEVDRSSLRQALLVVMVSAVCLALGMHGRQTPLLLAYAMAAAILGWVLWAWIAFAVGTTILKTPNTTADWGELLRTTGFATAPGVIAAAGMIEPLAGVAVAVASLWMLAAFVVAVRQALDFNSTGRAVAVCAIGWAIHTLLLLMVVSVPIGPPVTPPL